MLGASLALAACGKGEILDFRNAQIVNGKVYAGNANAPFSGTLTNVPDVKMLHSGDGWTKFVRFIAAAAPKSILETGTICEVHVKEGWLDGKVTCKAPRSDSVRYEVNFSKGTLDGPLKAYDHAASNALVSSVTFKNGQPDGKQEVYWGDAHKLVHVLNWSDGVANGKEEAYDETTGKRTLEATFVNGKLHGAVKQWDASGSLVSEKTFDNGVEIVVAGGANAESGVIPATNADSCVDGWKAAYRKEKGEDAVIAADQIDEWRSWCAVGKRSM